MGLGWTLLTVLLLTQARKSSTCSHHNSTVTWIDFLTPLAQPSSNVGSSKPPKHENKKLDAFSVNTRWPNNEIVYQFSNSSPLHNQAAVLDVITYFEAHTCLRFISRESPEGSAAPPFPVLTFMNDNMGGCWAFNGPWSSAETLLNLGAPGCEPFSVASHEMLHVLGVHHHHSRFDRDRFINIHLDKIEPGKESSFERLDLDVMSIYTPYDISSVMHYSTTEFGYGQKTITPKEQDRDLESVIRGPEPSHYDLQAVNQHYGCHSRCTSTPVRCEHDGYVDQTCHCRCVYGLTGPTCQQIDTSGRYNSPSCNGFYKAMSIGESYTLESPGTTGANCSWIFTSEPATIIDIQFSVMNLDGWDDWLELRYNYPGQTGPTWAFTTGDSRFSLPHKQATSHGDYRRKPFLSVLMRPDLTNPEQYTFEAKVSVTRDADMVIAPWIVTDVEEDWADLWYDWQTSRLPDHKAKAKTDLQAASGSHAFVISPTAGKEEFLQTNAMWDGMGRVCVTFDYTGGVESTPLKVQSIGRAGAITLHDTVIYANMWLPFTTEITRYGWFGVRFALGPGTADSADFYLDNIIVKDCKAITTTTTTTTRPPPPGVTTPPATPPPVFHTSFQTSFESPDDMTTWKMSGDRPEFWKRWTKETPSWGTGPEEASDGLWYLYFEATSIYGETATAVPDFLAEGNEELCLSFEYYFYGEHMGNFSVHLVDLHSQVWTELWKLSGADSSKDRWRTAQLTLPISVGHPYSVAFHAVAGEGHKSDYAIDDVRIGDQCTVSGATSMTSLWREKKLTRMTWCALYYCMFHYIFSNQ